MWGICEIIAALAVSRILVVSVFFTGEPHYCKTTRRRKALMKLMPCLSVCVAMLVCLFVSPALATPVAILTFEDPGSTAFTFTADGTGDPWGTLASSNVLVTVEVHNGPLAGPTPPAIFPNSTFSLTRDGVNPLQVTDISYYPDTLELEGGILKVFDASAVTLLEATFDFAILEPTGVGSSDLILGNVNFTGQAIQGQFGDPHMFSFSLVAMNPSTAWQGDDLPDWTANATFTCSAEPVPEPGAIIAAGVALAGITGITRKRLRR